MNATVDCGHRCCDHRHEPIHGHPRLPDACPACTAATERQRRNLAEVAKLREQLEERTG